MGSRFAHGPFPWCVTQLPQNLKGRDFLEMPAFNRANSSAVSLDSVRRRKKDYSLDLPTVGTLILKPSPRATDFLLHHPEDLTNIYTPFLGTIEAVRLPRYTPMPMSNKSVQQTLQDGQLTETNPIFFKITSHHQDQLSQYNLSRAEWIGLNDRNLSHVIHPVHSHRKKASLYKINRYGSTTFDSYNIITQSPNLDLNGAFKVSEMIKMVLARYNPHNDLRLS